MPDIREQGWWAVCLLRGPTIVISAPSQSPTHSTAPLPQFRSKRRDMSAVTYTSGLLSGVCFCGQLVALTAIDQETAIYCSTECARKDAMAALVAPCEEVETIQEDRAMSPRTYSRRSASASSRYSARVSALLRSFDLQEQHSQHQHQHQQQRGSHYRNRMRSMYTQDPTTGRQMKQTTGNAAGNRCSIFQDLAGEYSVDDGRDEIEWMRDLSGRNSVDYRLSSTPSEMLKMHLSVKKSDDSLAESFFGLDAMAASPSLQSYEDPVGWGEDASRVQLSDYSDLFPTSTIRRSRQLQVTTPISTEPATHASRRSVAKVQPTKGSESALLTVHLPHQAKRRQSRDLLCASLNAPKRPNTSSRRHSRSSSTLRSIISLPSKTCSALFNRSSKGSFHSLGISNRDEPCLYAVML